MQDPMLFIIGDYRSSTGPANVTLAYIEGMKRTGIPFKYLGSEGKAARLAELIRKLPGSDVTFFSGYSRQNLIGMSLSRFFKKPCIYLMHGSVEYENEINKVPDAYMARCEYRMMERADLILAVSEVFEDWLHKRYPEFEKKTGHLNNGVDWQGLIKKRGAGVVPEEDSVISIGGGMPRKRIVRICEAIELLREKTKRDITLTVAGDKGADSERIAAYPFVRDIGMADRDEIPGLLGKHRIFIQNSVFETFGLAPLEALGCGLDILVSRACGCLCVLKGAKNEDIINEPDSAEEIAGKLERLLDSHNNERIMEAVDMEASGWDASVKELLDICRKIKSERA